MDRPSCESIKPIDARAPPNGPIIGRIAFQHPRGALSTCRRDHDLDHAIIDLSIGPKMPSINPPDRPHSRELTKYFFLSLC